MIDTLEKLLNLLVVHGCTRFYAKKMSPTDNSRHQVYLGGDFSSLNIIPHGNITTDESDLSGSKRERAKGDLHFFWVDEEGKYKSPYAQLILYPKYPEVRMSGFLRGCSNAPSKVMTSRAEGRFLFLGVTNQGEVLGHAVGPDHPLSKAMNSAYSTRVVGVFIQLDINRADNRTEVISKLSEIYKKHWIESKKMGSDGLPHPYKARNGGGYTLEAELGISPNGYSEPDYLGWEVKQYGVSDFERFSPKSKITLMTPEPTGGLYKSTGVSDFLRHYGYDDKSGVQDRINFGGVYTCNKTYHANTGLKMVLQGYDVALGKITDMTSGIALIDHHENVAAMWNYTGMLSHWNRKHALAVYVPSLFKTPPPKYHYGPIVRMCEKTDFLLFLKSLSDGNISYEPGIKMEGASTHNPKMKRRSQFRTNFSDIPLLYEKFDDVQLEVSA